MPSYQRSIRTILRSGRLSRLPVLYQRVAQVSTTDKHKPQTNISRSYLRTEVQPGILSSKFQTEDDRDLVARLTEQRSSNSGQTNTNWRKIALYLDRKHISGWAPLGDPEFQSDCSSQVIFALYITRRFAKSTPGLGHRTGIHTIFSVLFVKRVEGLIDGYEWIGVGTVFGKEIEKQFQTAVAREARLLRHIAKKTPARTKTRRL